MHICGLRLMPVKPFRRRFITLFCTKSSSIHFANPVLEIEKRMEELSRRLQNTKGKKVYGYLKRDVKNLIDQIVDELEKDSRVSALYQAWGKWNDEILLT